MEEEDKWCLENLGDKNLSEEDLSACIEVARLDHSHTALPALLKIMKDGSYSFTIRVQAASAVRAMGPNLPEDIMRELRDPAQNEFGKLAAIALRRYKESKIISQPPLPDPWVVKLFAKIGLHWESVDIETLIMSVGSDRLLGYEVSSASEGYSHGYPPGTIEDWSESGNMKRITRKNFLNFESLNQQSSVIGQRQYELLTIDDLPCLIFTEGFENIAYGIEGIEPIEDWTITPLAYHDEGDISQLFRDLAQILINEFNPEEIEGFAFCLDAKEFHSEFEKFLELLHSS
jgi:hypothetical protein